jgi:hypothetical protein
MAFTGVRRWTKASPPVDIDACDVFALASPCSAASPGRGSQYEISFLSVESGGGLMMKYGLAVLLMFGMAATTLGDTTVYEDEDAFLAAIGGGGGYLLEDFNGYVYGGYTEWTLQLGPEDGYAGLISTEGDGNSYLWSGDGNMSTESALDWLRVDFNGENDTYSTGGWFFPGDYFGYWVPGKPTEIAIYFVDTDPFYYTFTPATSTDFRGFVATNVMTHMTIEAPDDASNYYWPTMDHYYIDSPEPTSLLLLGLGALLIRRR